MKIGKARHKAKRRMPSRLLVSAGVIVLGLVIAVPLAIWQAFSAEVPASAAGMQKGEGAVAMQGASGSRAFDEAVLDDVIDVLRVDIAGAKIAATVDVYDLNPADLLALPGSDAVTAVNLGSSGVPATVSAELLQPVADAVAAIQENGPCGFVFLDVGSGHGLVFNDDEPLYIASSAKAALAYHALTRGAGENGYERDNIESAIVYSDNDAYEAFAYPYFDDECIAWLQAHGVNDSVYSGDLYPLMSARSLVSIWAEILRFVEEGSDDAVWLAGLLSNTSVSFIRDALEGSGATVMNKGGWIADWEVDSVTDAAIVQADGRTYLMTIVTGMPAWESTEQYVSTLAGALFNVRDVM